MKNKFKIIIIVLLLILVSKNIEALGVSPGKNTLDFKPNQEREFKLTIHNTEKVDFTASVFARGKLSDYIEFETTSFNFTSDETEKEFNYKIKLPEKFEKPGTHSGEIVIREIKDISSDGELVIGALVAVVSKLDVKVPYEGKFATANLDIVNAKQDEEVKFYVRVSNLGLEDIQNAKAKITILDSNNKEITSFETDSKSIKSKDRKELTANWVAKVNLGVYKVITVVTYDNKVIQLESTMSIGDFYLKPLDISVKNFQLGQIAKFNVLVENLANRVLKDGAAQLILFDNNENKIMDIKSTPEEIKALKTQELIAFWDTENIQKGTYLGKLTLSYEDKTSDQQIRALITDDEIKVEIIGITAFAVGGKTDSSKGSIFIVIVTILILSNIAWFIYSKKFKKK